MASQYVKLPLSGGGGVSSLNTLVGDLSLVAGPGIVIAPTGPTTIQISSPGPGVVFPLVAPGGSVTAPSYAFSETGNDTGMYSTGDGEISFTNNAADTLTLHGNHNADFTGDVAVAGDVTVGGDVIVTGNISAANYPPTGNNNTFAGFDGSGVLFSIPGFAIDTNSGGMNEQLTESPNGLGGGYTVNTLGIDFTPLQNSPNDNWTLNNVYAHLDNNSSGFSQGTNGEALTLNNLNIGHVGTGNVGGLVMTKNYFSLGNGTDPITVGGINFSIGFSDINSGVTLTNSSAGYTFQPTIHTGAIINSDFVVFADYTNSAVPMQNYASVRLSPQLNQIKNNNNMVSIDVNPVISGGFAGNAGYSGLSISSNLGAFGTNGVNAIYVNPTATNLNYGYGLFIDTINMVPYAGTVSVLTLQDLTYTFNLPGDNNIFTVEYVNDGTAGAETFTILGNAITGHIQSGVSTATQVRAAAIATPNFAAGITVTISGTGSNAQTSVGPTNFASGTNTGIVKGAYIRGDVQIDGALSFTGGLSIGALNSFATIDISAFPPGVNSIDTLITQPTVAPGTTLTTDLLSINTAMLLTVGAGSTLTSSFLGYTALGLPAVVQLGAGSTIDLVTGATFAISLDGGAGAGSSIAEVDLCRAIAIPNGITAVTRLVGYKMDLPFGDPGTTSWGVYITPAIHNFMAGDLVVGDVDVPTNTSVGIELNSTTKALLLPRMTTVERDALTAVAGMVVFNTTTTAMEYYDGTTWV